MGFVKRVEETRGRHVGVDLRGDEALVPEELLDAADVGSCVEQVGGETVTEGVGAGPPDEPGREEMFLEKPGNASHREPRSQPIGEQRLNTRHGWASRTGTRSEPGFDRPLGMAADDSQTFPTSLAADPHRATAEVDVGVVDADELADAEPR
jgi:hypothetical protein